MNTKLERTIGEKFELDKINYQVVRTKSCSCKGCAFFIEEEGICTDYKKRTGLCGSKERKDEENVIFIKIGEATD